MRLSLKIAASAVIVVAGLGALDRFLHWMNQPSDLWLYCGLVGTISLLIAVPALLAALWSARGRRL
jgi:hypothetical protein